MPPEAAWTLTRRDLVDWLGKATVLALGADLLAACSSREPLADAGPDADLEAGPDADLEVGLDGHLEGGLDADLEADADFGDPWAFAPPAEGREPEIYRQWPPLTAELQDLEEILASWELRVDGLVERPITLGFAELLELERQDQVTDFHCVMGWSVFDIPWAGVHLSTLLALAAPLDDATHLTFHAVGGTYSESLPLAVALEPRSLFAYGVDGHTLPARHGFPVRMVVPRLLGYKGAKFVERIEVTDAPFEGYWVARGYPYDGEVAEERLRPGKY